MSTLATPARSDPPAAGTVTPSSATRNAACVLDQTAVFHRFLPFQGLTDLHAAVLFTDPAPAEIKWTGSIINRGGRSSGISKCLSSTISPIPSNPGSLATVPKVRESPSTALLNACCLKTCRI